jgi:homoserine dehydrogenase
MADEIKVGMLGLGVVGAGVARALDEKADSIARRAGRPVRLVRVLVRETGRERSYLPAASLTMDAGEILDDPSIQVVIEVLGGEQPACDYLLRAIRGGKHVVTANKEVMAKHGPTILAAAAEHSVDVGFEASVGGGIPLIGPFRLDLLANEIQHVAAILNGTTNYMLTAMAAGTQTYAEALADAQRLGYAEPDPRNDVEGIDAAYKVAILGSLAFHTRVSPADVYREGITRLAPSDFRYARELGYAIKLLAIGRLVGDEVELRVHPAFVPRGSMLAAVDGVHNAVQVDGDLVGRVLFYGRGAGP